MIGNISRLLLVIVYVVVAVGLLVFVVILINRGVQLVAALLGYEVGDFFQWVGNGFRRWRERRAAARRQVPSVPLRCEIVEVTSEAVTEDVVGRRGNLYRTDNGVTLILLDDGNHLWGHEARWKVLEQDGGSDV